MSDEAKIQPALTAEEWTALWPNEPAMSKKPIEKAQERAFNEGRDHALAALCLYGQPFGFTWEDVELLRGEAEQDYTLRPAYTSLADRIAALLPPREP